MNMKFFALALSILFLSSSSSSMSISKRGPVRLCGRLLAETLNMICHGQYYDPEAAEENDVRRHVQSQAGGEFYPEWYYGFPALRMHGSGHRLPFSRHARHEDEEGIVDQCCRNTCTYSVLLSYCGRK